MMEIIVEKSSRINEAIQVVSQNGGGVVTLKGGNTYICGSIILENNVTLNIEENAVILGSSNLEDYKLINEINDFKDSSIRTFDDCSYDGIIPKCFIYAKGKENIKITGLGIIDGNEEIYYGRISKYQIEGSFYPRIPLIFFEDCKNVEISNVTLRRSGFWTVHLVGVDNCLIDGVKIYNNLKMANCDGIDPDHSKNITIRNCIIEAADDCIVFKNTKGYKKYGDCYNINVTDCTLTSTSAAIKFGSESVCDFYDIKVKDVNILKSNRGISLQLRDEGNIYNCSFENINIDTRLFEPLMWWGASEPISITAVSRSNETNIGTIKDITFTNITSSSEAGILINGENDNISNLEFNNINVKIENKTNYKYKGRDLRPCINNTILGCSISYISVNNASNINFTNFNYESQIDDIIEFDLNNTINIVINDIKR